MKWFTETPLATDLSVLSYLGDNNNLAKSVLEDLEKSKNHTGLVQVERTVNKNGTTFIQKFWIRPDRYQVGDVVLQGRKNLNAYTDREFRDKEKKLSNNPKEFSWADDAYDYFGMGDYDKKKGKSFAVWVDTLDEDETEAISKYTTHIYRSVNGYLRGTEDMNEWDEYDAKEVIPSLEKAIDKFELKDDIIVHRKMSADTINLFKLGEVWQDDGFTSTTPIKDSFVSLEMEDEGSIDVVIHVKAGKGIGAWVAPISELGDENEFILNRGTQFKVKKISSKLDGKGHRVELEVVGRNPKELEDLHKSRHSAHIKQSRMDKFTWSAQDIKKVNQDAN